MQVTNQEFMSSFKKFLYLQEFYFEALRIHPLKLCFAPLAGAIYPTGSYTQIEGKSFCLGKCHYNLFLLAYQKKPPLEPRPKKDACGYDTYGPNSYTGHPCTLYHVFASTAELWYLPHSS